MEGKFAPIITLTVYFGNRQDIGQRQVFEAARYSNDKEKLKAVMEENRETYCRFEFLFYIIMPFNPR